MRYDKKGPCQNTPFDAISIFLREQETARSLHLHNLMKWSMNKFLLNEPYCMLFVEKYVQAIR